MDHTLHNKIIKMRFLNIFYLMLSCFVSYSVSLNSDVFECQRTSPCVCSYPNYLSIDLDPLLVAPVSPGNTAANLTHVYFYHPCQDAALNASDASKAGVLFVFASSANVTSSTPLNPAAVLNGTINGTLTLLATAAQSTFENTLNTQNTAAIKYTNETLVSKVQLDCVAVGTTSLKIDVPDAAEPTVAHSLILRGPMACAREPMGKSHRLSTGSVLVIVFLTGGLIYLVGGCLLNKYLRGAEGPEMIPHHDFWSELPGLVRDGLLFAVSFGRTRPDSYERI